MQQNARIQTTFIAMLGFTVIWMSGCSLNSNRGTTEATRNSTTTIVSTSTTTPTARTSALGLWSSELDPQHFLSVKSKGDVYIVTWEPIIDSDITFRGTVENMGAGKYSGTVDFTAGDEPLKVIPASIQFDSHKQTLVLDLGNVWYGAINFAPVPDVANLSCEQVAEKILESDSQYKQDFEKNPNLKVLMETESAKPGVLSVFDFRLYNDSLDGQSTAVVNRYRVDFSKKQISRYDPIEAEYVALYRLPDYHTSDYFDLKNCK